LEKKTMPRNPMASRDKATQRPPARKKNSRAIRMPALRR
jgi:hypothetical protein